MAESELLSRAQCREIFGRVERAALAAGAEEVEVMLGATRSALTRFANNSIHQSVADERRYVSIRARIGGRTARATTNRLEADSLSAAAEYAVEIARAVEPDPELLAVAEPAEYGEVDRYRLSTARSTPQERARVVAEAIALVREASQTAAGIYSAGQSVEAILNSRGLFCYYFDTLGQFSITAMDQDSSGWAKASAPDSNAFDALALARRAAERAALSRRPRELAPGRYTVILEPAATGDLAGQLFPDFSATAIRDQRSFLTGRLGTQLFGAAVNIADDVCHPLQCGPPFDGEGVPRRRLALVEKGVVREVAYSRQAARRASVSPTGHGFPVPNEQGEAPVNIVMEGGGHALEDLIASTGRGILVTRLWYIREVDPYQKIMTGLTRDGTFLIEGGRLVCGLRNLRFNQNLIELLNNVEAMSPAVRTSGEESFDMVVPALKVREFNFTEVTKF
ncbi:MAG: TldD/PmbA family protein [Bryobacteraceae bacterium]|jgi:predicted Zn-dependent protease